MRGLGVKGIDQILNFYTSPYQENSTLISIKLCRFPLCDKKWLYYHTQIFVNNEQNIVGYLAPNEKLLIENHGYYQRYFTNPKSSLKPSFFS